MSTLLSLSTSSHIIPNKEELFVVSYITKISLIALVYRNNTTFATATLCEVISLGIIIASI
jgi:hypothetical protein